MPPRFRRMFAHLAVLCALGAALPARAQTPPPAAATPAQAAAAKLPPDQARQLIDLLNDPAKRAQFTQTLQAMLKAAPAPAPAPAAAVPLAPNSLGAQIVERSATWASELGDQASAFTHLLGNLPAVWRFTDHTLKDPGSRAHVLDAAFHLTVILLVASIVEIVFGRLLRRPVASLARHAPNGGPQHAEGEAALTTPPPHADDMEDREAPPPEPPHRRFGRTVRALRRLPFAFLRLLLDLLPVLTFLGLAYAGAQFTQLRTQAVLVVAVFAYAGFRLAVIAASVIASPEHRSLRLVHLSDQGAAYVVVWVRRLALVAAFGYAAATIGGEFGMPNPARAAFLKAVALIDHVFLIVIVLQCRKSVADSIRGRPRPGFAGLLRRRLARFWPVIAIFFIVALWLVWAAQVHDGLARVARIFAVTGGITIAGRLAAIVAIGALDRAFRVSPETAERYPGLEARANRYYPILRRLLGGIVTLLTLLALLQAYGADVGGWFRGGALGGQVFSAAVTILIAAAVALGVWEIVNASLERHLAKLTRDAQLVRSARLRTLLPILRTLLLLTLGAIFGLTALSEIGVNIAPLLAGAGILGVALGFGSQKLVQDFITGIFLLLENAMQVGDWVTVAGLSGSVENLSIRTMRLRAGDGSVHIIPFSAVSTVTNVNRGIGNAAVSVTVPIEEDTDHVSDVLADIAKEMRGERRFGDMMRSDFQLWGVDKVENGTVTITGQIVCTDSGRWGVQREFNRRLNLRFKQEGIRVATPVQTVYQHVVPPPRPKLGAEAAEPTMVQSPPPAALGHGA